MNQEHSFRNECSDNKWWEVIPTHDGYFIAAVGQYYECFALLKFKSRQKAYYQKNKWLTEFNIECI